jgi:hypothetical protein
MTKAFLGALTLALMVTPIYTSGQAQVGCKSKMTWPQVVIPSPPYNACGSEMKTTFAFDVFWGTGGYSAVHCIVINSGWDRYYSASSFPVAQNQKVSENWHCTSRNNHQLQIDVSTDLEPGRKFNPHYLMAEYWEDSPPSPEP